MGEQVYEGALDGRGKRFAIVVSRFNEKVTSRLLDGAHRTLVEHGAKPEDVAIVYVPGAFELPATVNSVASCKRWSAVIALGCVIRGETPHFEHVARAAVDGCEAAAREHLVPVALGVLTCDNAEQAMERAGGKAGHKGAEAALAAIEMADLWVRLYKGETGRPPRPRSPRPSATPDHLAP